MANKNDPAVFWREYEAKIGETILKYGLSRYVEGAEDQSEPLWGLSIATSGGFRFHHFPHQNWLSSLFRASGADGDGPVEKTFFIPKERLLGVEVMKEKSFIRKFFNGSQPRLILDYRRQDGTDGRVEVEIDMNADEIALALKGLLSST